MIIYKYPHPILTHKCQPLLKVDQFIIDSANEMLEFMYGEAVGLAATQVGIPYSFFVTALKECPVVINPVIRGRGGLSIHTEGCLSIPGLPVKVRRNNKIKLFGYDLKGEEINIQLEGIKARICLHELDHINGIRIIDKSIDTIYADNPILSELESEFIQSNFDELSWKEEIEILEKERNLLPIPIEEGVIA